jgi:hypothetical protein
MDLLVSVMEEYKCPLYDPQVPERYDEMVNDKLLFLKLT